MMVDDLTNVGDKVVIQVDKEARSWGYNPAPDGTVAEVVGFSEIPYGRVGNFGYKPGIYHNRSWPKVKLPTGEVISIGGWNLEPFDKAEYDKKYKARKAPDCFDKERDFIRNLPETKFWEHDEVKPVSQKAIKHLGECERVFIVRIDYGDIGRKIMDGSPWPFYVVSDAIHGGWTINFREDDFELVKRGNVWNYYHNLPLVFKDLKEKANFYQAIGRTKEVRNPANKIYRWTKDEVLKAIQDGIAHSMRCHGGFFGGDCIGAEWFLDEEVGKEVAKATLEGFGITE